MLTHTHHIRVRYGETDQMGFLYYGNYAQYYEVGRAEAMRALGISYKNLELEFGILMPVMSLSMRYVRPAYYDELLRIETTLRKLPEKTMTFYVEIFNEKNKLVNGGSVKLCFMEQKSGKTVRVPAYLMDKLQPAFEAGSY